MALVHSGYMATFTVVDTGSNRSTLRYYLTAATAADAEAAAVVIASVLAGVTDAEIQAYQVSGLWEDAEVVFGGGEIENMAVCSCLIDTTEVKYATVKIPAPKDTLFQAAGGPLYNEIDPDDAALQLYLVLWMTGQKATLSDGETIQDPSETGVVRGHRVHRKSRRG